VEWWAAEQKHKRILFWDVLCNWPAQALKEYGELDLLENIVQTQKQFSFHESSSA
jgi:hypothetical protein